MNAVRRRLVILAAELLERDAAELKRAHSVDGRWRITDAADRAALEDHTKRTTLAQGLRRVAEDV